MTDPSILVRGLGKRYRLGMTHEHTLSSQIARMAGWMVGRRSKDVRKPAEDFWALRDVNLEIMRGEAVGIVGSNGAGKSTLLKVLARITPPTTGSAIVRGRLSSLLEVGTGFHPDLSGRENIFLNGAILGMRTQEVVRKFDEIVAFAGVEQFIDTPVKRYSSGMYVRLAFAVAAHLEPDVLVIDEVLAVGDAEFQKRCLGKMDVVAREGRTVIFVSHNLAAMQKLCTRAVWLSNGSVMEDSDPASVVDSYLKFQFRNEMRDLAPDGSLYRAPEGTDAPTTEVLRVDLLDPSGQPIGAISTWDRARFRIRFRVEEEYPNFSVELTLGHEQSGRLILTSTHPDQNVHFGVTPGTYEIECAFDRLPLAAGEYVLGVKLAVPKSRFVWNRESVCKLLVLERDVFHSGLFPTSKRYLVVTPSEWMAPVRLELA